MTCWTQGKDKYVAHVWGDCRERSALGIGKGTHLYCASLPGINRRLALLTEQVPITLCKLRAEDLRVAFHELEKEEFRDRHKM